MCNEIRQSTPNQHETEGLCYIFYIYTLVIKGRISKFLIPMVKKKTLLSHRHVICLHLFTQLPNSPNSPSATRRHRDLQVKGMLLQMIARPQGQTMNQHDPEDPVPFMYGSLTWQCWNPDLSTYQEKMALSRSLCLQLYL